MTLGVPLFSLFPSIHSQLLPFHSGSPLFPLSPFSLSEQQQQKSCALTAAQHSSSPSTSLRITHAKRSVFILGMMPGFSASPAMLKLLPLPVWP